MNLVWWTGVALSVGIIGVCVWFWARFVRTADDIGDDVKAWFRKSF